MSIYLKLGTVGAGKSSKLINEIYSYTSKGRNIIVCKSDKDTRNMGGIESRSGQKPVPCETISEENTLFDLVSKYNHIDAIFIDEVQLLTKQQCEDVIKLSMKYPILCYGLKSDYKGLTFDSIALLGAYSKDDEEVINLCTYCNSRAKMNMRLIDGKPVFEGESILVDKTLGVSEYIAVCPKCYLKERYK